MPSFFGKSNPTPRTAADRERQRLERERRRGTATGDDGASPPATPNEAQPAEPAPRGTAADASAAPDVEPVVLSAPAPDEDVPQRVADASAADVGAPLLGDPAVPSRPAAASPRSPPTREAPPPRPVASAPQPRRRLTAGRIVALIVVLFAVGVVWFGIELFEPFTGSGHGRIVVDVPRGAGASEIGDLLARRGVVASGFFFNLYASLQGDRGDLHSGRYVLREGMSYSAALAVLTQAPAAPPVVNVVVPEGDSRVQIAALTRADGLTGSYLSASVRSPLLNPSRYGAPRGTPNLEGFLFPATYDLVVGANVRTLVADQLTAFTQNVGAAYRRAAHHRHLTLYQLLIVASMIEREAYLPADRPKVAAVIYNRLRLAMPLGIDATLRYALNDWNAPLTEAQLGLDSAYNTRLRIGLPPTPIGNPGLASLNAAAHPAAVPYLYYVDGADGCGELVFSSTAAAFDRDAAAYHAAIAANHGRVPSCHRG